MKVLILGMANYLRCELAQHPLFIGNEVEDTVLYDTMWFHQNCWERMNLNRTKNMDCLSYKAPLNIT